MPFQTISDLFLTFQYISSRLLQIRTTLALSSALEPPATTCNKQHFFGRQGHRSNATSNASGAAVSRCSLSLCCAGASWGSKRPCRKRPWTEVRAKRKARLLPSSSNICHTSKSPCGVAFRAQPWDFSPDTDIASRNIKDVLLMGTWMKLML